MDNFARIILIVLLIAFAGVLCSQFAKDAPESNVSASTAAEQQDLTLRDQVARDVIAALGRDGATGLSLERDGDGYAMYLEFDISDNFSSSWIRDGAMMDVQDVVERVSTRYDSIAVYHFVGSFPLVDQYGNSSVEPVLWAEMSQETARRINWRNMTTKRFEELLRSEGSLRLHPAIF